MTQALNPLNAILTVIFSLIKNLINSEVSTVMSNTVFELQWQPAPQQTSMDLPCFFCLMALSKNEVSKVILSSFVLYRSVPSLFMAQSIQCLSSCHDIGEISKVTEDEDAFENASISCIPLNIEGSLPCQLPTTQTDI